MAKKARGRPPRDDGESTGVPRRYRLDDLRRLASSLGIASGLTPERAAAFATHLLWHDAAGASTFGVASLPGWLDRIEAGEFDPRAEGKVGVEHAGTAVLDGRDGLPPLILARAAALAGEKAREVGVALIRVTGLRPTNEPAAAFAAELAIGPLIGLIVGPGGSLALALPSAEGLPAVFDPMLGGDEPPDFLTELASPWAVLVPDGGSLILALAVKAVEPLSVFHDRLKDLLKHEGPTRLLPSAWESHRREVRERGVRLSVEEVRELQARAERIGAAWPEPARSG